MENTRFSSNHTHCIQLDAMTGFRSLAIILLCDSDMNDNNLFLRRRQTDNRLQDAFFQLLQAA